MRHLPIFLHLMGVSIKSLCAHKYLCQRKDIVRPDNLRMNHGTFDKKGEAGR